MIYKLPLSVLVVIYTSAGEVLLLERALQPGYWQSVTGALDAEDESPSVAAQREVAEETGIVVGSDVPHSALQASGVVNDYEIFAQWRHRYAPGVKHNRETVFTLQLPARRVITLAPREHRDSLWLPIEAAAQKCFSPSNAAAIRALSALMV